MLIISYQDHFSHLLSFGFLFNITFDYNIDILFLIIYSKVNQNIGISYFTDNLNENIALFTKHLYPDIILDLF